MLRVLSHTLIYGANRRKDYRSADWCLRAPVQLKGRVTRSHVDKACVANSRPIQRRRPSRLFGCSGDCRRLSTIWSVPVGLCPQNGMEREQPPRQQRRGVSDGYGCRPTASRFATVEGLMAAIRPPLATLDSTFSLELEQFVCSSVNR
jgi:hypothetical protein